MDRAKKKLASAIDGLRNLHTKCELELEEKVSSEHICLAKIVRHGFPDDPRCIAYDPVQRLIAIGSGHGSVRILGDAGVDCFLKHESDAAVLHLQFIINEGMLIAACRDDLIHLWSFKTKIPELVQSIQINKEQVTCINLPFRSKWLYVGTERGNVYFVNVVTFSMSCYAINWNKAIDLSCRTHPGSVKSIRQCPTDVSKLLIVYEKGVVIVWNVLTKEVDRFQSEYMVRCATWHQDGKQLLFGNADGSLTVWNLKKSGGEMIQRTTPHGAKCRPITQVDWRHTSDGEQLIVFNGGMPQEDGVLPSLTIIKGSRSATVLEMDYPVVAFLPLTSSPYPNVPLHPFAVAVLLKSDLLVVDMNSSGYPCFENANPMDIHESRVTLLEYFSDCPIDLLGALTLVGCKQRRQNFSDKAWPISGGVGRQCATGHQELLLTGHEDGSLKFWQASGETLQILYKLKTGRHFEKSGNIENKDISHAVAGVEMCLDARLLLVASQSGQVTLFRFYKAENAHEIATVNIPNENKGYTNSCADDQVSSSSGSTKELKRQGKALSQESQSSDTSEGSSYEGFIPLKVRGGALRRPAGYQPELVCLIPWRDDSKPEIITAMKINSAYGILAIGTESGLVLVDTMQYTLIYSWSTLELYGRGSIPSCLLRQNSETPSDPPQSADPYNSPVSAKSFVRFNTETRQKSVERRPMLTKAQSAVAITAEPHVHSSAESAWSSRGDSKDSSSQRNESRSPSPVCYDRAESQESVTSLCFMHSYARKNDTNASPSLWIGTSKGSCIVFNLLLPIDRMTSTVVVAPSGSALRTKGHLLYYAFLDQSFCIITAASESYKDIDMSKTTSVPTCSSEKTIQNKVITKCSLSPTYSNASDYAKEDDFCQLVTVVSEEEIRTLTLPSYCQVFFHHPDIPLVMARSSHIRGHPILMALNAAGHIAVFSLPTVRPLFSSPLCGFSVDIGDPICRKTSFSEHGLGIYSITPSEVQKFTVCSELAAQVNDCLGDIYVPTEMPEPPKTSFLKGVSSLFAAQKDDVDLDNIFADKGLTNSSQANPMRSMVKVIPGPSANMEQAQARGVSAGQAAQMAIQALSERGEKLSATVDATERLRDNAMNFSQKTGKLVEKYEKKKWYNL